MQENTVRKNEKQHEGILWKNETTNSNINHFTPQSEPELIAKFITDKAVIDFSDRAFSIKKVSYGITQLGDKANKYSSGYISIRDIRKLQAKFEKMIQEDEKYRLGQDKDLIERISKKGYFEYYGIREDKENNELYSKIFKIMPAKKEGHFMILVQSALGVKDEKGMVKPSGTKDSFFIPVEYYELKGEVDNILNEWNNFRLLQRAGVIKK